MSGYSYFDDLALALETVGAAALGQTIAAKAAVKLDAAMKKTLAAGQSPDGKAWEATKSGGRAYKNAAEKLKVSATGNLVVATITGAEAWGHEGTKKLPVRQMLPDAGGSIPKVVSDAIEAATIETLKGFLK